MQRLDSGLHVEEADELPEYRSVCASAIVGLLLALFSPLALIRTILLGIPMAAIVVCVVALMRIRSAEGKLIGKTPAVLGLGLATVFAAAAPAQIVTFNRALHARATPIALAWLEALQRREPHKAHQLTKPERRALNDELWGLYVRDEAAGRELEEFVDDEVVRFLLTMGEDAEVRFYERYSVERVTSSSHFVTQHFAVTFEEPSQGKTTFFLSVQLERREGAGGTGEQWRVADFVAGVRPAAL